MVGAYGGGLAAQWFSGTVLLLMFSAMMIVTAMAMFRGRNQVSPTEAKEMAIGLVVAEGLIVGAATGLVGAGGGFLVVPALVLLGGMDMHKAIGTSLMVIALKSFAAFAGHASHVAVDFQLVAIVTTAAVMGSLVGAQLNHRVPAKALRKGFAFFVLLMAGYIIWREAGMTPALIVTAVTSGLLLTMRALAKPTHLNPNGGDQIVAELP